MPSPPRREAAYAISLCIMSFVLDCPTCRKAVTASREMIGRVMACPHCASHFTLPREGEAAVPVAQPTGNLSAAANARFTFDCQRCGSILEAKGDMSRSQGRCPTCGALFVIPRVDPQSGLPIDTAAVPDDGQLPTPMHAYATAGHKAPKIHRMNNGEQVILCSQCGQQMPIDANSCTACGVPFTMDAASEVARSGPSPNNLATAALTVGIISILAPCVLVLGSVAIGLGIAGVVRAENLGTARPGRNMAIAGIVLGVLSLGLGAAWMTYM